MFYTEITKTVHMIAVATSESDGDNLPLSCYKFVAMCLTSFASASTFTTTT